MGAGVSPIMPTGTAESSSARQEGLWAAGGHPAMHIRCLKESRLGVLWETHALAWLGLASVGSAAQFRVFVQQSQKQKA